MPLSEKAAANILRLLNTEDERNSTLAFRLLNSQNVVEDFLLSLCGHFMTARGEERLALRNCLRALLRITAREWGCSSSQQNSLMWLLNYDPEQEKADPERFLSTLEVALAIDVLPLARYIYGRTGRCARILLRRGDSAQRAALLNSRMYDSPYGRALDLSRMQLIALPDETYRFPNLEALDISYNRLALSDVFPFQRFRFLRFLGLSHNKLERVPDGLPLLSSLEEVDLRGNPMEMGLFEYLRHPLKEKLRVNLALERGFTVDQFSEEDIACLLKNWISDTDYGPLLGLAGKELRVVPTAILRYPQLAFIDLRNNPIAFLPPWLLRMPRLREIYCYRGVEYNPAYLREGLTVYRDDEAEPPGPAEEPPPWLANLEAFPAELPVKIPVEGLRGR